MKLKSLVLSVALISGLSAYDISKNQTLEGYLKIHAESDTESDAGFSMASFGLKYRHSINEFTFNAAAIANFKISEEKDAYDDDANKFGVREFNIEYVKDKFSAIIGRQELDFAWIGDYHDAVMLGYKNGYDVKLGVSRGKIVLDDDAPLEDYERIKDKDGKSSSLYFGDLKLKKESLKLNPYLFGVKDKFLGYGIIAQFEKKKFKVLGHYARSDEEAGDDGWIYQIEGGYSAFADLKFGYIQTSKDGIGSLADYGDNINPLEEGNLVYEADAKTFYIGAEKEIKKFKLGAMYGKTDTDNLDEDEINFNLTYAYNDNLEFEFIYSRTDNDNEKTNNFKGSVTYSF